MTKRMPGLQPAVTKPPKPAQPDALTLLCCAASEIDSKEPHLGRSVQLINGAEHRGFSLVCVRFGVKSLSFVELGDVPRQEVIEHGADGRDHRELGDVVPGRRHGGAQDVGGQGKFQPEQDPGGETKPDLAAFALGGLALRDRLQQGEDGLKRPEGDDEYRAALDGKRDVARDYIELRFELDGLIPPAERMPRLSFGRNGVGRELPA